jgi:PAS domain S-box-containing protein
MTSRQSHASNHRPNSALEAEIEKRFGVLPNFFRLCPESPQITANLWGFAKFAYLDNSLSSVFKERLFVHLSRFCEVRYCIARHVGFLVGLGRPAGDAQSALSTVDEVVRLLQRPFPRGTELDACFGLSEGLAPLTEPPAPGSELENAVFAFAGHIFLQTPDAERCQRELKRLFGPVGFQNLALFLAFVRTAHYWTKIHHDIAFEDDINHLLAAHQALAECILNDPEVGAMGQRIIDELSLLRERADRSGTLLASIVENSDDAIVSKTLDGVITSWNRGAERLFGYSADEAIGQPITLIVPIDRRDEETKIIESLRRGEQIDHFQTVRQRKDGTFVDISLTISPVRDTGGNIVGASKIARDISSLMRTERALAELARLLDLSNDAILVRDAYNRITYWNKGATEVYGYSREEALGRMSHDLFQTVFPDPLDGIEETLRRDGRWTGELLHKCKDGREIIVTSRWALDRDLAGNPLSILETNNDITKQKHSEQELLQREEQLRTLNDSLETKVRQRTQEVEKRTAQVFDLSMRLLRAQDNERRHIARELHDASGQTMTLIAMKMERFIEKIKRTAPELATDQEVIRSLIEKLNQEIRTTSYLLHPPLLDEGGLGVALPWYVRGLTERGGLDIRLIVPENIGRLSQDMELVIFRVIQECLTNVRRHSGSKTAVIRIVRDEDKISVEVIDQGKGISPENLGEIQSRGAGIGVRGMRERVRQFNGDMKIESNGAGTNVSFTFPLGTETAVERRDQATV